jgi:hypothetical protein
VAQGTGGFPDAEVARVVLQLDEAATLWRRAASASLPDLVANPTVPIRPSRIELAVFTALAQTYGRTIIDDARFLPVIDYAAECGAVVLVQRVLWGEQFEDVWIAAQLRAARVAFEVLCGTWPDVFMTEADKALAQLGLPRLGPVEPPSASPARRGRR